MAYDKVTQYDEDSAHTTGDKGMQMLAVRDDTLNIRSDTEGDYEPLHTNADGALWTKDVNSAAVLAAVDGLETLIGTTNSSLSTIDGRVDGLEASNAAIQTAAELLDDTVKVLGTDTYTEATSKGIIIGGVRRDADTTLANTTNEFAPIQLDANGYVKVEIFDGGGSHTVDNNGTFAVQVDGNALISLQLIDDVVYTDDTSTHSTGTSKGVGIMAAATPTDASVNANDIGMVGMTTDRKLHVAVMDALPAGSAAIGKLAANSGVDIGDVDVTSVIAGTGATNLGKARDSAIGATDTGVAILGVRRDTPTAETPAAGDYIVPQYSANGEAWVRLGGELADDAAFTVGTTRVIPNGLLADETAPDSVDEGDIGIPRMTLDRKAIVTAYPSSTTGDGLSVANFNSGDTYTALTNSAQVIKASAGNFYGYYIYNPNSSATYVMIYNIAAASVTVGTSTASMVFCIPATSGANLSLTYPIPFTNAGWSIAAATTGGGNSAPATALEAMIFYK